MRYLYILAAFFIITFNANAQHYRLKTLAHESYFQDSLKFIPIDTFAYFYSNGKGGVMPYGTFVANENSIQTSTMNYKPYFVPDMRYDSILCSYNRWYDSKKIYSVVKQDLDGNDNIILRKWISIPDASIMFTDSFTYVSNKMAYSFITICFYYSGGLKQYHYNSLGQLDTISAGGSVMKTIYVYNTNGTIYRVYNVYTDNINALFNNMRSTYNYNTSGQLTAIITDLFDTVSATFNRNGYREFYSYTTANDTNEIVKQKWDVATGGWVNQEKRVFLFDANHNVLSNILIEWKNNAWDTFRRSSYTYNAQNLLTYNEVEFWNKNTKAWEYKTDTFAFGTSQRFTFTYEYYSPASVTSTIIKDKSINLYPVPAVGNIIIEVNKEFKQPFHAAIYDMQGKIYTEWSVQPCSAYKQTIPIDNLPTGNYCIKLSAEDGDMVKRFTLAH